MKDRRSLNLLAGHTLHGRPILASTTGVENWIRMATSETANNLLGCAQALLDSGDSWAHRWAPVLRIADTLIAQRGNPIHYGDSRPGHFDAAGNALVDDAQFTWADLFQYGVTGPAGFEGFLRDCALPDDTDWDLTQLAIGLLLVEDTVAAVEDDRISFAAFTLHKAQSFESDLRLSLLSREAPAKIKAEIQRRLSERGKPGGLKSAESRKRTAAAKPFRVLAEVARLQATGNYAERELNGVIARKLGVSADWIGKIRRRAKRFNQD